MITVRDVLTTEAFEHAKIVAGMEGLDNTISTVTVAEVPDAANWLRGNELVCTTGFFIRDNTVSQVRWIESLIQHGAKALAIKTKRFLGGVVDPIIRIANIKKFPVIELPEDSTWPYVIESVMNRITAEQVRKLKQAEEIHISLTKLVLDGESIQTIAATIASLVDNPVIIEDGRFNFIAKGYPNKQSHDGDHEMIEKIIESRTKNNSKRNLLKSEFYKRVIYNKKREQLEYKIYNDTIHAITLPVMASNIVYGFITLIQYWHPYEKNDIVALEQGSTTIALQLVRSDINYKNEVNLTKQAIEAMIQGRMLSANMKQFLPDDYDFSLPIVAVCAKKIDNIPKGSVYIATPPEEIIKKCIIDNLNKEFKHCLVGHSDCQYTVLVSFKPEQINVISLIEQCFKQVLVKLESNFGAQALTVGIGGMYTQLDKLGKSFEDAKKALEIIESNSFFEPILSYDNLGVHRVLSLISYQDLKSFCDDYLFELLEYDYKTGDSLCDTLSEYLKAYGNITITARKMFVHPNTISYRLKKIQMMLPKSLDNQEFRLSLELALEIRKILKKETNKIAGKLAVSEIKRK